MIKVIAFDLVGVLIREKDIDLSTEEDKIERLFGPNISDSEFMMKARDIISNDSVLMRTTEGIIDRLYEVREPRLFQKLKEKYPDIKIVIATNHVSYIRNYIGEMFGLNYLDDFYISAELHKIKPNKDFYEYILNDLNIKSEEMLFLDDNQDNVIGAEKLGINTIKINKDTNIFDSIDAWLKINNFYNN